MAMFAEVDDVVSAQVEMIKKMNPTTEQIANNLLFPPNDKWGAEEHHKNVVLLLATALQRLAGMT